MQFIATGSPLAQHQGPGTLLTKTLLVMRLTILLLIVTMLQARAAGYSQTVSLKEKNAKLESVFKKIEKQTGFYFWYEIKSIQDAPRINIDLNNLPLNEALNKCLTNLPFEYTIVDKTIVIRNKPAATPPALVAVIPLELTGRIVDENQNGLAGASVKVKGTDIGTATDADGRFSLTVTRREGTLVISFVGYEQVEIPMNSPLDRIVLQRKISAAEEIVVIGYGAVKQRNLTGAVSSIKSKDMNTSVNANFQQALQGKAAGVQVIQPTGQPGAGVRVQIRSNPSAANAGVLYVIDGVPVNDAAGQPSMGGNVGGSKYGYGGVDKSPLNFINPNDIASIEILKDASAASIYGARAGAGVVLITTKKGVEGKAKIDYMGSYGIQRVDKMYPVYGAKDYMTQRNLLREEMWYRDNKIAPFYGTVDAGTVNPYTPVYSQAEIDAASNADKTATEAITQSGYTQQHNLSLSGGNGKTSYFASGNYFDQKGVIIGTGYQRYNGRINIDQVVSEKIKLGASVILSNSNADNTITGGQNENGGIVTAAIYWAPNIPLQNPDGSYPLSPYYPNIPNPISYGTVTDKTASNRSLASAYGEWKIITGLKARAKFSYDHSSSKRSTYFPRTFYYGQQANGAASIAESEAKSKLLEYTFSYDKAIGTSHNISAVAGYNYQQTNWEGFNAANQNFLSDVVLYYNLGSGQALRPTVGSSRAQTTWASYFARAIYTYNGNITLQASIRRDGSSVFADNKKWGYFPGVSAGWVLSDESFMPNLNAVSFLKLRAGYGETGNSEFGASAFQQYGTAQSPLFGTGAVNSGLILTRDANPNLTWETAGELNIGLDLGFFNNRLSASVDYFNKTIRNLITFVPYPSGFIINGVYRNSGKTRSTGYDIALQSKNIVAKKSGGLTWSTTINFSHYLNYWVERSPEALAVLNKYEVASGRDALFNPIFGIGSEGIFKGGTGKEPGQMAGMLPGGIILRDIHGYDASGNLTGPDGAITAADMTYLGNGDPRFNFGFGNQFTFKNFDLNIFMSGLVQKKWSPYANGRAQENTTNSFGFNAMPVSSTRWTFANPDGNFPTALSDSKYVGYQNSADYWLVDGSFLRCRNITLGYTMPRTLMAKQKLFTNVRLSFDVQNPFTFTSYPGLDPELNTDNFYPLIKSYVFGLNVGF
ncbi:putative TonB-dependent receptor [Flavihumibacter petaseus NBRC 106054]|uniref:Putative TonB-dependent receptor n=2 Tax=Flavihumibacter TaxID=1004301 RepID=A0A0E9MYN0_9BACT|nr:putative TonB-dependent receptor [Flavihumibacter petaseus NBRC 106054]